MKSIWKSVFIVFVALSTAFTSMNGQEEKDYIMKRKERLASKSKKKPLPSMGTDSEQINALVTSVLGTLATGDSTGMGSWFAPDARVYTLSDGAANVSSVRDFAASIHSLQAGVLTEEPLDVQVEVDDYLASAWVPYILYQNGKIHHCGVDAFTFYKMNGRWKITQISDSRRTDCNDSGSGVSLEGNGAVSRVLDTWHHAASEADLGTYFGQIAGDGIFLGTDAGEYWEKGEFLEFARPYFEKGEAWSFKPKDRNIYFSEDGKIAWFDELLDTWMGTCRGSGVLQKDFSGQWKIEQYNLAITVPNEVVQEYLELLK